MPKVFQYVTFPFLTGTKSSSRLFDARTTPGGLPFCSPNSGDRGRKTAAFPPRADRKIPLFIAKNVICTAG